MGGLLKAYKATLSPAFQAVGVHCRHAPTCSEYAAEAASRHGVWAGAWMGLARVCRCRPGGSHGWDPVPTCLDTTRTGKGAHPLLPWRYGEWSAKAVLGARPETPEPSSKTHVET
ncbi:MAG: membrane protein insertion efficiency factor YidD [Pseudomonadota bacterium]